jgi:hypothetical protein
VTGSKAGRTPAAKRRAGLSCPTGGRRCPPGYGSFVTECGEVSRRPARPACSCPRICVLRPHAGTWPRCTDGSVCLAAVTLGCLSGASKSARMVSTPTPQRLRAVPASAVRRRRGLALTRFGARVGRQLRAGRFRRPAPDSCRAFPFWESTASRLGTYRDAVGHAFQMLRNMASFAETSARNMGCRFIDGEYLLAGTSRPSASAIART